MWCFRKLSAVWVSLLFLSQCTFHPLYKVGESEAGSDGMSKIKIDAIDGRLGQMMRNALLKRLTPKGQARDASYILEVILSFSDRDLGIAKDATSTQSEVTLVADYVLKDCRTGDVLYKGRETESSDYDVLTTSYYSNLVSKENAKEGLVEWVANLIQLSLAHYFMSVSENS
jgi:LPS-assembly lipoprotein